MTSAAANNPQALIGATLAGLYTLDRLLSEGRHGALFDARHARTGMRYAVRLVNADARRRDALIEQLKKAAVIVHPHLAPPHEIQVLPDGQLILATPFLPGQDLNQRVAARGKLSLAEGTALMRQTASALHALQQAGAAHGNLSATNVFFCRYDDLAVDGPLSDAKGTHRVVLIDLGLSILDDGARPTVPTSADDQRALGRMVMSFVSDLNASLRQVLDRTQEVNPDSRYRTIADLWRFFDEAASAKPGAAPGKGAVRAVATTVVPTLKRDRGAEGGGRRRIAVGASIVLAMVLVGIVAMVSGRKKTAAIDLTPPPPPAAVDAGSEDKKPEPAVQPPPANPPADEKDADAKAEKKKKKKGGKKGK